MTFSNVNENKLVDVDDEIVLFIKSEERRNVIDEIINAYLKAKSEDEDLLLSDKQYYSFRNYLEELKYELEE